MKRDTGTIAAVATPPGRGGVGIVRVSGPAARQIGTELLPRLPSPRRAVLMPFLSDDGVAIDEGIALWMPGPASFTGEDVLELQGHGGPVVMDLLLSRVISLGARPARPGEFSERAFLNDRLDLAQAEAIADLIDSGSADAARAAARSLIGELSAQVHVLTEAITELRIFVEAAIDFPEEEVDFLADRQVVDRLQTIQQLFDDLFARTRQGALLREGMTVVIAGAPNAGKSSLLNRLAGYDAAIVTDVPGTTRDVLREHIDLDGMPLHIIDTAGLRNSDDVIEQEGVRRAHTEMASADRVLLVVDSTTREMPVESLPEGVPVTVVFNKIDLTSGLALHPNPAADLTESRVVANTEQRQPLPGEQKKRSVEEDATQYPTTIRISARTGAGLDDLRAHLEQSVGFIAGDTGVLMARRRHIDALERAHDHLQTGHAQLTRSRAGELLAEELRLAQQALGEITGEFTSDELLGRIFSSFCIGK